MNLHEFQVEALREIYDAELQAAEALPRMAGAASSLDLRKAFEDHAAVTKRQVQRLEDLFRRMGAEPERKESKAMRGLAAEADEFIRRDGMDPEFRDAALNTAEQKIEHFEAAAYNAAAEMAEATGQSHAARVLRQILREEEGMSRKLAQLSLRWLRRRVREEQRAARGAA